MAENKDVNIEGAINPPSDDTNELHTNENAEIIPAENTSVIAADEKAVLSHLKSLDNAFKSERKAFIKIACELYWFKETQAYAALPEGYSNIEEFSKDRYGIKKAMTYQYLGIVETFGMKDKNGNITDLDNTYKDYSVTQLISMKGMSDDLLKQCSPDMKVSELKKLAALSDNDNDSGSNKEQDDKGSPDKQKQTEDKEKEKKSSNTIKRPNTQELYNISTIDELDEKKSEILESVKKILSSDVNGMKYSISIAMTW